MGCGGGGGKYYPPQVAINKIGVVKQEINEVGPTDRLFLNSQEQLEKGNERYIQLAKYYYFRKFDFIHKQYTLAIPINNWVSIIDSSNRIVIKLDTLRYTRNAAAIELVGKNGQKLLAIYIDQQATSHSSTLYILSEKWDILYKEHLLGAEWMAKESSPNGDNLIIAAEKKWIPKDKWITVGGPWRYIIFHS